MRLGRHTGRKRPNAQAVRGGAATALTVILVPLLGQSNMVGRSTFDGGVETDGTDIFQYANDPAGPSYETIISDITPLYFPEGQQPILPSGTAYQMGPGNAFLKKIATQNPGAKIIAVPCAVGATGLVGAGWASSATPGSGGANFEAAVGTVNDAYTAALAAYPGASVHVITAWVQGENDAVGAVSRATYGTALTDLITHWRARVSGSHGKFVIGSMLPQLWIVGSGNYSAGYAAINAAHVDVSIAVSNAIYVAGPDERASNDNLHYGPYSVNVTFGQRMGDSLADATGPSVTTGATQGGYIGTTSNILLEHDDGYGHATFHFAGGTDDALFEITDPYVNGTTQPQVRLIDNTEVAGDYVLKVKARDGAGNYGADRTITFTQAAPAPAEITTYYGVPVAWPSGFGASSTTIDIKEGLNLFTMAYPAGGNEGSAAAATVNGNAATKLGYSSGSSTCVLFAYESAVDISGATVALTWGGQTMGPLGLHAVVTGVDATPTAVVSEGWGGGSAPQRLPSLTVPTDGIAIGIFHAAADLVGVEAGTDLVGIKATDIYGAVGSRDATGQIGFTGGGTFYCHIGAAFAKTA